MEEKKKISSGFVFEKTVLLIIMFFLLLLWSDYKRSHDGTFIGHAAGFMLVASLLIYFLTRPAIYYDDHTLYIKRVSKRNDEISFANIQSIKYSILSFQQWGHSYRIKYMNDANEIKSIRLFPNISGVKEFIVC